MRKILLSLLLATALLFPQDPPDVNWHEINTAHYRIIFPQALDSDANTLANQLVYLYPKVGFNMGNHHPKIPLILSNRSTISNGYVTAAPYKSEWYALPYTGESLTVGNWYHLLALHEIRHVFQYAYLDKNIIRLFHWLFGDFGKAISMNMMIPDWYMEGDAILSETLFSQSGRGRMANFQQSYRAILLENEVLSYEKTRFGSYKTKTPNDYVLGFYMVTNVARDYGFSHWQKILDKATSLSFNHPISPISGGLDQYTRHKNTKKLFYDTQDKLHQIWRSQDNQINAADLSTLRKNKQDYFTNFTHPYLDKSGSLYYVKSGFGDQAAVYRNNTKLIEIPGSALTYGISISENYICWSQYSRDKRWDKESFSDLAIFDIKEKETTMLTSESRLFCPAISPSERYIAAVKFTPKRNCFLVIVDRTSGRIINKFSAPNNEMLHYPAWSKNNQKLVLTATGYSGRAIYEVNISSGKFNRLTAYSFDDIFYPKYWKDKIIYKSDGSGINNIFALDTITGKQVHLTNRRFGANYPFIQGNRLIFADYSAMGYEIKEKTIKSFQTQKEARIVKTNYFQPLLDTTFQFINLSDIPQKNYSLSVFQEDRFNYHSYAIYANEASAGVLLFSENLLETMSHQISILYDYETDKVDFLTTWNYLKTYPKISAGFSLDHRRNSNQYYDTRWKELNINILLDFPLWRRSKGIKTTQFAFHSGVGYKQLFDYNKQLAINSQQYNLDSRSNFPVHLALYANTAKEKAYRDLVPTATQFSMIANQSFSHDNIHGNQQVINLSQSLNFGNYTGVNLTLTYEQNDADGYRFDNYINHLPLHSPQYPQKRFRMQSILRQHLWFPDIDFFFFLYIKRFSSSLLFQHENFQNGDYRNAIGLGLTTEIGGIGAIRLNLPFTVYFYVDPDTGDTGLNLYFPRSLF